MQLPKPGVFQMRTIARRITWMPNINLYLMLRSTLVLPGRIPVFPWPKGRHHFIIWMLPTTVLPLVMFCIRGTQDIFHGNTMFRDLVTG
jgi:hypothetical protein